MAEKVGAKKKTASTAAPRSASGIAARVGKGGSIPARGGAP